MASFCNKYFLEGPQFEEGKGKHRWRRVVGLVLPAALVHFIWWPAMAMDGSWDMFVEKEGGTGCRRGKKHDPLFQPGMVCWQRMRQGWHGHKCRQGQALPLIVLCFTMEIEVCRWSSRYWY